MEEPLSATVAAARAGHASSAASVGEGAAARADDFAPLVEGAELTMLRDSARSLLHAEWPSLQASSTDRSPAALRRLWSIAVAQGWAALELFDAEAGLGAAIVLQQELGRADCPLPLLDTLLADAVLRSDLAWHALRDGIARGEVVPTWSFEALRNGTLPFVEHAAIATHLFHAPPGGEIRVVALEGGALRVTPGLAVPPLAEAAIGSAALGAVATRIDAALLAPLARLLLAARAWGAAQCGLERLTEYAKVRTQFGHPIGHFQAMQHRLADGLIAIEICRLALHDAGAAPTRPGLAHRADLAAALAGETLRQVALDLHHGFGGISFWDGHEMPRIFRRVHADLVRLGGVRAARRTLADALLAPGGRIPEFDLGPAAEAFRIEVRAWLAEHWHHQLPGDPGMPVNHRKASRAFSRQLGAQGWLGASWAREHGGQDRDLLEHLAFEEEMAYSEAPVTWHNTAATMIGPALAKHGSPAQQAFFLPGIARGDLSFALGYSEPDHGSDLAGMRTRATRAADGGFVIRGQKTYTSTAGFSTHVWLAVRTGSEESRHRGISVLIVPLDAAGITMQPMLGLNGHRANTVFYDDVKVGPEALVGAENGGWEVIASALSFERVSLAAIAARARGYFDRLLAHLQTARRDDGSPVADDPLVRDRIGQLGAQIEAARLLGIDTAVTMRSGQLPLHRAAMVKVYASELMERLAEAVFDLLGTGATLQGGPASALLDGRFEYAVRDALLYTIGGGTNDIQRTLIAQRGLGLPR